MTSFDSKLKPVYLALNKIKILFSREGGGGGGGGDLGFGGISQGFISLSTLYESLIAIINQ